MDDGRVRPYDTTIGERCDQRHPGFKQLCRHQLGHAGQHGTIRDDCFVTVVIELGVPADEFWSLDATPKPKRTAQPDPNDHGEPDWATYS
jgi:hypothetical protein